MAGYIQPILIVTEDRRVTTAELSYVVQEFVVVSIASLFSAFLLAMFYKGIAV